MNNAAKYSEAHAIKIKLSVTDHTFVLDITDDGKGFDASSTKGGNGLRNIKGRAEDIQGKATITSTPGAGTRVLLEVPLT